MPEPGNEESLEQRVWRLEQLLPTLIELRVELRSLHDWRVSLQAQLAIWRWVAPIVSSIIASVITAAILSGTGLR